MHRNTTRIRRLISPFDSFFSETNSEKTWQVETKYRAVENSQIHKEHLEENLENHQTYNNQHSSENCQISDSMNTSSVFCELCEQELKDMFEFEHHYESVHCHLCSECELIFPSAFLLGVHLEECHSSYFEVCLQKNTMKMYQCLVEDKSICNEMFKTSEERDLHMISHHMYEPGFRFEKMGRPLSHVETNDEMLE
ncbi:hypothetical protein FDP41_005267 [Naegleria fowleri]|uniref:C2H2-type domain-containing protein n=1 Tax=Naegleria fowleri TaxID=5763 RepID=A0A6A5BPV8_NAEFO|nr:uncharacterized protein FDP41_005267 [Naegleria fowleri]KAF0975940.1 hypothetical protein FDP41_005267 [Naegleria fowleri]CAG4711700.1 unnamed protein product [Naegleria fowleri]